MDGYELLKKLTSSRLARGTLALPNVIGVGAPRCGTSWLSQVFEAHPQIRVPPGRAHKEMNFFGIEGYGPRPGRITLPEYSLFFEEGADLPCRAEFTPVYLGHDLSLAHMCETLPDVKAIVQVRDRLDRLWSHFKYHRQCHGFDDFDTFVATALDTWTPAVRQSTEWFSPAKILSHSLYAPGVDMLLAHLGRDRILLLDYELLIGAPADYAKAAFEFAAVDPIAVPDHLPRNSSSPAPAPELPDALAAPLGRLFEADRMRLMALVGNTT